MVFLLILFPYSVYKIGSRIKIIGYVDKDTNEKYSFVFNLFRCEKNLQISYYSLITTKKFLFSLILVYAF